jgi:hypothetical protein
VGAVIRLVGANFLGATSVAFNGGPAGSTVKGANYITALVPAGATSGMIRERVGLQRIDLPAGSPRRNGTHWRTPVALANRKLLL